MDSTEAEGTEPRRDGRDPFSHVKRSTYGRCFEPRGKFTLNVPRQIFLYGSGLACAAPGKLLRDLDVIYRAQLSSPRHPHHPNTTNERYNKNPLNNV